ncbi:hypothetical protein MTR_5g015780 [Medicago truncatula]|uniref:Uncharacterized protein n=1 Tax=Medicago truncatula TaxID=3880 RepID=G7K3U4_MEDTR|nr:hypothetical protein MTR_5g015780 [Medicago truncatula]
MSKMLFIINIWTVKWEKDSLYVMVSEIDQTGEIGTNLWEYFLFDTKTNRFVYGKKEQQSGACQNWRALHYMAMNSQSYIVDGGGVRKGKR